MGVGTYNTGGLDGGRLGQVNLWEGGGGGCDCGVTVKLGSPENNHSSFCRNRVGGVDFVRCAGASSPPQCMKYV